MIFVTNVVKNYIDGTANDNCKQTLSLSNCIHDGVIKDNLVRQLAVHTGTNQLFTLDDLRIRSASAEINVRPRRIQAATRAVPTLFSGALGVSRTR
jgi:hypothetical protein